MIQTLDQVTINGSQQIWNGYIYALNYQPSFGQTPSYLTMNFVSEDGTFSINQDDLEVLSPYTISIGDNIQLSMYPVDYKRTEDKSGKLLEVKFIDTSIALDKVIVVLNGRQGSDGNEYPIDPYGPGPIYANDAVAGSCYIPVGRQLLTIADTYNTVLPVVYSFPELCDAIGVNGITIDPDSFTLIQNSNQFFFASYIGTLRGVLQQWCTDLGYGFYWENNAIHFLDLTTNLVLNTSSFDTATKDAYTEEVTIEDTVGRVACAFYGQDRQWISINPAQDTQISFKQVSLVQVGYSADDISAIKAAFLGEDFFYAYNFFISFSNEAGSLTLGMPQCTAADTSTQSKSLDLAAPNNIFNQYYYSAMNKMTAQQNFKTYRELVDEVGRYFYIPMTRGDWRNLNNSVEKVKSQSWYPKDVVVSSTMLAKLASPQSKSNESLQAFLLGTPYVPPSSNNTGAGNPAEGASSNQGYDPTTYISPKSDNDDGFLIVDLGLTSWQIVEVEGTVTQDGVYINVTPEDVGNYLQANDIFYNLPLACNSRSDPSSVLEQLTSLNGQSEVLSAIQGDYVLQMWGVKSSTPVNSLTLSLNILKTPEDLLGPNQLLSCVLTEPGVICVPKVEEFLRSETDKTGDTVNCHSNVIKNEMNFQRITNQDLLALGTLDLGFLGQVRTTTGINIVMPAVPNYKTLQEAFQLFCQNLTFSKVQPTIIRTYHLPYIDLPDNYQPLIGNGLMSLKISINSNGVSSEYTMGTRFMSIPSIESIRMNIEFQRGTNQSRFLPYGWTPFGY